MQNWGILFDLDDTLFDSEAAYAYALSAVKIDSKGQSYQAARAAVKERLGKGHVSARNRLLYLKEFLIRENRYTHSALLSLMDQYETHLVQHVQTQWKKLNRNIFFEKFLMFPRVVITNENARTQTLKLRAIDESGLYFPSVVTSEEMGEEKPSQKLFLEAVSKLKLPAEKCLMVGDSLETDILPALALGMKTVLTTEFKPRPKEIPPGVTVISKLEELMEILH